MTLKKGEEYEVLLSATRFDYDESGKITGFENEEETMDMDLTIRDKDKNIVESSSIFTQLTADDAETLDLEDEMKFWVKQLADEENIEKYSLKNIDVDYGENQVWATLIIE